MQPNLVTMNLNRSSFFILVCLIAAFTFAPALRADIPPDQVKAAGAIPLTTELLDKMDKFVQAMTADNAAKAELTEVGKDPSINPDNWGSTISAKCPKTVAVFKANNLTPDEFSKAIFAIMALSFSDEFAKSEDKAAKANYDFLNANKDRANTIFGGFLALRMPPDSASPASTP